MISFLIIRDRISILKIILILNFILDGDYLYSFYTGQKYVEIIMRDTNIDTKILQVSAHKDVNDHGIVEYSLMPGTHPEDIKNFRIDNKTGWISLIKPLDVSR